MEILGWRLTQIIKCLSFSFFSLLYISYLSGTMTYLLGCLRGRDKERPTAFITLGLLAVAVGPAIKKYLPKIMEVIKASLPTKVFTFGFTSSFTFMFVSCLCLYLSLLMDLLKSINDSLLLLLPGHPKQETCCGASCLCVRQFGSKRCGRGSPE